MRRRLVALAAFAVVFAACSFDTGSAPSTTGGVTDTTATPFTTTRPEADEASSTTAAIEATGTTSGRPLAPDFTLELGDGSSFTLSEGAKPVYLVFWAEW